MDRAKNPRVSTLRQECRATTEWNVFTQTPMGNSATVAAKFGILVRWSYTGFRSAYLTMSFFSPCPGKWTVTLACSPLPSRRITVPTPHFS